jgi:hypothetical protein
MTAPFKGKVTHARFTDETNLVIEILFDDKGDGNEIPYIIEVGDDNPFFVDLVEDGWDLEKIAEETIKYNRLVNKVFNDTVNFWVKKELAGIEMKYINQIEDLEAKLKAEAEDLRKTIRREEKAKLKKELAEKAKEAEVEKSEIFDAITTSNKDEEVIFKMKQAIFTLKDVKDTKDRSKKLKLRKAKTLVETLSAYYDLIE